jgi:hypothetical protein
MREIKFRFWHAQTKVMHDWEDIKTGWDEHDDDVSLFEESDIWKPMQFTGLKDGNGKDIYESDVLTFTDASGTTGGKALVDYDFKKLAASERRLPLWDKVEVIGNIYENPELLYENPELMKV